MKRKMVQKLPQLLSAEGGGERLKVMLAAGHKLISGAVKVV